MQSGQPGSGARGGWSARSPEGSVSRPGGSLGGIIGQQHDALPGGDPGLMTSVVRARDRHGSSAWRSPKSHIDLVASISRDVRPRKRRSGSPRCPPGQV